MLTRGMTLEAGEAPDVREQHGVIAPQFCDIDRCLQAIPF